MSGTRDKIKGYYNDAVGNAKQVVGRAVGSEKLEAEGVAQEVRGEAQKSIGAAKDAVADAADAAGNAVDDARQSSTADTVAGHYNSVVGGVKQAAGRALGDRELEAKGVAQEVEGEAQKISGDVKRAVE